MQKLQSAPIKEIVVTNSVAKKDNEIEKIKHIDIADQITETMKKISEK